jgi:hypothetical protein
MPVRFRIARRTVKLWEALGATAISPILARERPYVGF